MDLWLYDLKHADAQAHKRATGVSNRRILANLRRLAAADARIWLRVPLVPGYNDSQPDVEALALVAAEIGKVERLHLMPYHRLGTGKYARLGALDPAQAATPPSQTATRRAVCRLGRAGAPVHIGG